MRLLSNVRVKTYLRNTPYTKYMKKMNNMVMFVQYHEFICDEYFLENNKDIICVNKLCNNKNGFELLLRLGHVFDDDNIYHKNTVFRYYKYCEICNIPFTLIKNMAKYDYVETRLLMKSKKCVRDYTRMK